MKREVPQEIPLTYTNFYSLVLLKGWIGRTLQTPVIEALQSYAVTHQQWEARIFDQWGYDSFMTQIWYRIIPDYQTMAEGRGFRPRYWSTWLKCSVKLFLRLFWAKFHLKAVYSTPFMESAWIIYHYVLRDLDWSTTGVLVTLPVMLTHLLMNVGKSTTTYLGFSGLLRQSRFSEHAPFPHIDTMSFFCYSLLLYGLHRWVRSRIESWYRVKQLTPRLRIAADLFGALVITLPLMICSTSGFVSLYNILINRLTQASAQNAHPIINEVIKAVINQTLVYYIRTGILADLAMNYTLALILSYVTLRMEQWQDHHLPLVGAERATRVHVLTVLSSYLGSLVCMAPLTHCQVLATPNYLSYVRCMDLVLGRWVRCIPALLRGQSQELLYLIHAGILALQKFLDTYMDIQLIPLVLQDQYPRRIQGRKGLVSNLNLCKAMNRMLDIPGNVARRGLPLEGLDPHASLPGSHLLYLVMLSHYDALLHQVPAYPRDLEDSAPRSLIYPNSVR